MPRKNATVLCCYRMLFKKPQYLGTFNLKYPYLKRISWPLFKDAFLRVFKIGWNWMMLDAHSSMNLVARHFIAEPVFIVFCILKPEAYAQKLDRSKTPAQLHIMNWHPDILGSFQAVQKRVLNSWPCPGTRVSSLIFLGSTIDVWRTGKTPLSQPTRKGDIKLSGIFSKLWGLGKKLRGSLGTVRLVQVRHVSKQTMF